MVSTLKYKQFNYSKLKDFLEPHGSLAGLCTYGSLA
jgi:hypothetical protein